MRQCGVVMSIEKNKAKVVLQKHSACGDCKGCRWGEQDMSMEIEAINPINAKIGDRVEVDMEHQNVLFAAFIAYVIPMFALIAGVFLGNSILGKIGLAEYQEVGSAITGLVATAITYLIIRTKEGSFKSNKKLIPVITQISSEEA